MNPATSEVADFLLDLRELLLSGGHPGKCVKCFFGLLGDLHQPGALKPLGHWLERHLEVSVEADGCEVDRLPVHLDDAGDLDGFCQRTMDLVRMDRAYQGQHLRLSFCYKERPVQVA